MRRERPAGIPADRFKWVRRVERDRADLLHLARSLQTASDRVDLARRTLLQAGTVLRWTQTAGSVAAVWMWLRTGRRPPLWLLASLSLQLVQAIRQSRSTSPA